MSDIIDECKKGILQNSKTSLTEYGERLKAYQKRVMDLSARLGFAAGRVLYMVRGTKFEKESYRRFAKYLNVRSGRIRNE